MAGHRARLVALTGLAVIVTACGTRPYAADRPSSPTTSTGSAPLDAALVTPAFGWVLTPDRFMLTHDGGKTFTDAKVSVPPGWARAAYFSDATHGVMAGAAGRDIVLVRTSDGGATWTRSTLTDPGAWPALQYSALRLAFGDTGHGALLARTATGENFSVGTLFSTANGGSSWSAQKAPVAGQITVEPGGRTWLAGGVLSDQLYTTTDTGKHWTRSTVPKSAGQDAVTVAPPVNHILPATVITGGSTQVELFTTADNGHTWRQSSRVAVHGKTAAGVNIAVARTDNGPLVLDNAGGHAYRPATSTGDIRPSGLPEGVFTTTFTPDGHTGWALSANGACLHGKQDCALTHTLAATSDDGATWQQLRTWTDKLS